MKSVLTESLDIVRPLLPSALFAPEVVPRLWEAAGQLVPIPPLRLGFECRLAAHASQVDVQQGFARGPVEPAMLADYVAAVIASGTAPVHPAWHRIHSFCSAWLDSASPLHEIVELWLECDLIGGNASLPAPSVFLGLDQKASPAMQTFAVAEAALDLLAPERFPAGLRRNLHRCFEACGDRAIVSHLGVMLARDVEMLRVNIKHLPADEILAWLECVGWPGSREEAVALLAGLCGFVDAVTVCLDVGREISPRIGFECFLQWQPGRETRWAAFMASLVARGVCTEEKADALMSWPGYTDPSSTSAPWPAALVAQSLVAGPERFTVLNRELMHVKVTWQPQQPPEAKAYFGFFQSWLLPEGEAQEAKKPVPATPKATPATSLNDRIRAAMEGALTFLLRARNQAGWWLEYDDFEQGGPSDEWATAYVAAALAPLDDERAGRAARWAWTLLSERCEPSGGWGWNIVLPCDADSTLWALRLAAGIGAASLPRARRAREFLFRHALSDGGMASYHEDYFRRFTGHSATPHAIRKWFEAHTCITAAASVLEGIGEPARAFLRQAQRENGSWKGYWWPDDEYTTMLAAEALAQFGRPEDRRRLERAAQWALDRIGPAGTVCSGAYPDGSAFATACCIRILNVAENRDAVRETLNRAIGWLLEYQRPEGSWAPAATLYANPDENPVRLILELRGVFTTATVIAALGAIRG